MSLAFKDYYQILGVERSATAEEIQRAYRKLARTYHPDVNKDPAAEAKYQEMVEAYEVLKNPETRQRYDQFGPDWKHGQSFEPPTGGQEGPWRGGRVRLATGDAGDFAGFSDFFRAAFGGLGGMEGFQDGAGFAERFGADGAAGGPRDGRAGGSAHRGRSRPHESVFDHHGFADAFLHRDQARHDGMHRRGVDHEAEMGITLEEAYQGVTKTIRLGPAQGACAKGGEGGGEKSYQVRIPRGVTDGTRIRLGGQGGSGRGAGAAGDLYIRVRLLPHERFTVAGHDLETTLEVTPWEAALGASIPLRTLGETVSLRLPAGAASGQVLRLRGKGLPRQQGAPGDLRARVRIVVPKTLSAEERRLFTELRKVSSFNPRA